MRDEAELMTAGGAMAQTLEDLCEEELKLVFSKLDKRTLARCQVVCKRWREVAGSLEVRKRVFMKTWGATGVLGIPRSKNFLELATLPNFVYEHSIEFGDTIAALSVRHRCDCLHLRITNGLSSDHAITTRKNIYVPVRDVNEIKGRTIVLHYLEEACREVCVVQQDICGEGKKNQQRSPSEYKRSQFNVQHLRRKLPERLRLPSSLGPEAARYYLIESEWDIAKAQELAAADEEWVRSPWQTGHSCLCQLLSTPLSLCLPSK